MLSADHSSLVENHNQYSMSPHLGLYSKGNVKVFVRVGPGYQKDQQEQCGLSIASPKVHVSSDGRTIILTPRNDKDDYIYQSQYQKTKTFYVDRCFQSAEDEAGNSNDGQEAIYEHLGKVMLDHNIQGYNSCILAYGHTGTGKTYTMMGTPDAPGIIPRTCNDLFRQLESMASANYGYSVRVSYFEIYNEQVRDLLATPPAQGSPPTFVKMKVRESPTEGPYVKDLIEQPVKSYEDVKRCIETGNKARTTAATAMNNCSSRSHAVFTLIVRQKMVDPQTKESQEKISKIRMVDLAGSERINRTNSSGDRLKEGTNINKSLTTLGRVIHALAENKENAGEKGSGKKSIIPYRDSILTWLLKESLGGNSMTAMISCISADDYNESLATLRYASRVKYVKNEAVVNQEKLSAAERTKQDVEMTKAVQLLQASLSEAASLKTQNERQYQEMEKFRQAVTYFEEKASIEEMKMDKIREENDALKRHNRLMSDHIKMLMSSLTDSEHHHHHPVNEDDFCQESNENCNDDILSDHNSLCNDLKLFLGNVRNDIELIKTNRTVRQENFANSRTLVS